MAEITPAIPERRRGPGPRLAALLLLGLVLFSAWGGGGLALAQEGQININTADVADFEKLPMIGPAKAQAIVSHRQRRGAFTSADDLRQVPEVGEATFRAISPYLTLSGPTTLQEGRSPARPGQDVSATEPTAPLVSTSPGSVTLLTDQHYYPVLRDLMERAVSRIDLVMFLFKTTGSSRNLANRLVEDLLAAKRRGVMVNVVLEKSSYDPELNRENAKVGARLRQGGVKVRFDGPRTTTHAKFVVIDHRYCLLGSHNFTSSALSRNHEASLLVDSPGLASQLLAYMGDIQY